MCGINGFNFNNKKIIELMNNELNHRGIDSNGFFLDGNVSLGHVRLSIQDLSSLGNQPMFSRDKNIILIFNGEIYNFKNLKKDLSDFKFKSNSDTEVLLNGYLKWGLDKLLEKIDGIFSFVIYDKRKNTLFLVRDFTGVKPLYYYWDSNILCFSSEIKSILKNNKIKLKLNKEQLASTLFNHFTTGKETTFNNIYKVKSGHYIKFDLKNNKIIQNKKYWDIKEKILFKNKDTIYKNLRKLMEKEVKKQLIADVEVGSYLSGGLDSTIISSLAQKYSNKRINTISVGFDEGVENELKWAKLVAKKLKTNHHECIITGNKVLEKIERILESYDEPMLDPGTIPNYFISEFTNKLGLKVVLAGEGSDELFGGYGQFNLFPKINFISLIPKLFKFPFIIYNLFPINFSHKKSFYIFYESFSKGSLFSLNQSWFNHKEVNKLLNLDLSLKDYVKDYEHYFNKNKFISYKNKLSYVFLKVILGENYNMKADKMTMAHTIEERVPFQSKNLIEFVFKVDPKIKFEYEKEILKKSFQDIVPNKILTRKKRGYGTPIEKWVTIDLKDKILSTMKNSKLVEDGIFNKSFVDFYLNNIEKKGRFAFRNFALYSCEIWYRKYLK